MYVYMDVNMFVYKSLRIEETSSSYVCFYEQKRGGERARKTKWDDDKGGDLEAEGREDSNETVHPQF